MDINQELCSSLIKWLQTFKLRAPHKTAEEISDGVAMAEALTCIAPDWFNEKFMSKIKADVGSNRRLKISNLKKIVEAILDYYQEVLNQQLINFVNPDVTKIGETGDPIELGRLLQLLLGCAVNCAEKQAYITVIMGMEESVQRVIMQAIQELESGNQISLAPSEDLYITKLSSDLDRVTEERDQVSQKCHELDLQVSLLLEEKSNLQQEVDKLQSRLQEIENPISGAVSSSKYALLRREFDALKEEMFKVECARDDARVRFEAQERTVTELQARVDDLQALAEEATHLKDEMDILRETAEKAGKYEATIESYKRKLEELSDLKRQCKSLEEKNAGYQQMNNELEEWLKKQGAWKSQAEAYKKQISELIQKQKEETNLVDKLSFENTKANEKIAALIREKERLTSERNLLREANEELTYELSSRPGGANPSASSGNDLNSEANDKLARLIQENHQLKLKEQDVGELAAVQALLEAANEQINNLQLDSRTANKRILELESQLEEAQVNNPDAEGDEAAGLRKEINSLRMEQRSLNRDLETLRSKCEQQEEQIEELQRRNTQLKDTLTRKESELSASEEKFKKCMEKAKVVISSFEPKQQSEVAALKNQVLEKNNVIQRLEQDRSQQGLVEELRLMAAAYRQLSAQRQRDSVDQRLATLSSGQSFLVRQRAPVARRVQNK